jgi:hypothetical protein
MDASGRRVTSIHEWGGRRSRRSEISSSGEVELLVGSTRSGVMALAATVLVLAAAVFLGFPAGGCCRVGLGLLRPGRLPSGAHFRLLGCLRDQLRSGISIWGRSGVGLDDTPPRTT